MFYTCIIHYIMVWLDIRTEMFDDTKGTIQSRNRRRTDNTMKKDKRTNNDLQNTTKKTTYREQEFHINPGVNTIDPAG